LKNAETFYLQIMIFFSQSQQSKARATAAIKEADGQVDSSDSLEEDKKQKCLVENGEKTELEATNKSGKDEERDGNDSEELKAESGEVGLETGDGSCCLFSICTCTCPGFTFVLAA